MYRREHWRRYRDEISFPRPGLKRFIGRPARLADDACWCGEGDVDADGDVRGGVANELVWVDGLWGCQRVRGGRDADSPRARRARPPASGRPCWMGEASLP